MFRTFAAVLLVFIFAWGVAFGSRKGPATAEPATAPSPAAAAPEVHDHGGLPPEAIKHSCATCRNCCTKCNTNDLCCCVTSSHCSCPPPDPTRGQR